MSDSNSEKKILSDTARVSRIAFRMLEDGKLSSLDEGESHFGSKELVAINNIEFTGALVSHSEKVFQDDENNDASILDDLLLGSLFNYLEYAKTEARSPESYRNHVADCFRKLATKIENPYYEKPQLQIVGKAVLSWIKEHGETPKSRKELLDYIQGSGCLMNARTLSHQLKTLGIDQTCRDNLGG